MHIFCTSWSISKQMHAHSYSEGRFSRIRICLKWSKNDRHEAASGACQPSPTLHHVHLTSEL